MYNPDRKQYIPFFPLGKIGSNQDSRKMFNEVLVTAIGGDAFARAVEPPTEISSPTNQPPTELVVLDRFENLAKHVLRTIRYIPLVILPFRTGATGFRVTVAHLDKQMPALGVRDPEKRHILCLETMSQVRAFEKELKDLGTLQGELHKDGVLHHSIESGSRWRAVTSISMMAAVKQGRMLDYFLQEETTLIPDSARESIMPPEPAKKIAVSVKPSSSFQKVSAILEQAREAQNKNRS